MTVVVTVFLVGMCGVYLWHLWAGVLSRGKLAAGDRLRLITLVLEAALMLFLARILIAWTPLTSWAWGRRVHGHRRCRGARGMACA